MDILSTIAKNHPQDRSEAFYRMLFDVAIIQAKYAPDDWQADFQDFMDACEQAHGRKITPVPNPPEMHFSQNWEPWSLQVLLESILRLGNRYGAITNPIALEWLKYLLERCNNHIGFKK